MGRFALDRSMWRDEDFYMLPPITRLLFIGLIAHADEHGCMVAHIHFLSSRIFPFEIIDVDVIDDGLAELAAKGFIRRFEVAGKSRLQVMKWFDAQNGYVYVARHGDLHKIGFSVQPVRRMYQLKRELGVTCKIVLTIETPHYRNLETELHQRFSHKRVSGEWFNLDAGDLDWFATFANEQEATNG